MEDQTHANYRQPELTLFEVEVEQGYAQSIPESGDFTGGTPE